MTQDKKVLLEGIDEKEKVIDHILTMDKKKKRKSTTLIIGYTYIIWPKQYQYGRKKRLQSRSKESHLYLIIIAHIDSYFQLFSPVTAIRVTS